MAHSGRLPDGVVFHALPTPGLDVESPVAASISGPSDLLERAEQGLPPGAARPEAAAALLGRADTTPSWGEPHRVTGKRALVELCRQRGASSVEIVRADPTLLPALQLGTYFSTSWRRRVVRRVLCRIAPRPVLTRLPAALAADVAFWKGVRSTATRNERERLTRSSYVVVFYHRVSGDRKPGQDRLDVTPERFERHMKWLRRLGMRAVPAAELIAFHTGTEATLPRRAFVLAADDGFRDAVVALGRHADLRPYLFVPTSAAGGSASWIDGEQIASWEELTEVANRGAEIGSHTQTHVSLPDLDAETLAAELEQSLRELRARMPHAPAMLAYPHGRNDERVREATAAAGYRIAFATDPGRNGAGTDPYRLRRVGLKDWDGPTAVIWKACTGELVPWPLERWKLRLAALRRRRRRSTVVR
jgi:peptidoglycan/xylan/chitin deacetylase (PgdA/CDA1 family)